MSSEPSIQNFASPKFGLRREIPKWSARSAPRTRGAEPRRHPPCYAAAEIAKAGHAVVRFADAAGDDALESRSEVRRDIEGDAVERNPAAHADADRGDLVFGRGAVDPRRLVRPRDPDADAGLARFADHRPCLKRVDQPALERADEGAQIGATALEIEHNVSDALSRPMIGELSAAPGAKNGKSRVEKVTFLRARACGVERGCSTSQTRSAARPTAICSARDSISATACG